MGDWNDNDDDDDDKGDKEVGRILCYFLKCLRWQVLVSKDRKEEERGGGRCECRTRARSRYV